MYMRDDEVGKYSIIGIIIVSIDDVILGWQQSVLFVSFTTTRSVLSFDLCFRKRHSRSMLTSNLSECGKCSVQEPCLLAWPIQF